ncbi:hypothetical protein EOK75_03000 [Pseudorhodobacter turbinis]|uniref:Uncharacterized protein n=1 Tax=Pseudorhodobacter turbinis TaxID=2500533 RepID=A0A4P8EEK8_9RHOB|nr:DUF5677 domain-containing protein [Pseudorhodobacter turbinis]QCO54845.1 hypothetical protein EOK75_03000 [Pseudorhodobacter turbinis]
MEYEDKLSILDKSLRQAVEDELGTDLLDSDEAGNLYSELFEKVRADCEASSLEGYKNSAPELLAEMRVDARGFEERNFERWKPSFDHIEMMWSIAQELGEMHGKAIKAEGGEDDNPVMAALAHIFPRALLVTQEIICLLKGGFPDGAFARWRSLHELTVTAMFIEKHGEAAAIPYFLSFRFAERNAAKRRNLSSDLTGIRCFTVDEMAVFEARCDEAERILGRSVGKGETAGEWPKIMQKHPQFDKIEKDVGMDIGRPVYKMASTHTHANHRPMGDLLGMFEADAEAHLVGPSNSGFVTPLRMTAVTLAQITMTYLFHGANADRIVHADTMAALAEQMATIAKENERVTREAFDEKAKAESGPKN